MREIKFRGKRTDTKEWVYGNLLKLETDYFTDSNDTGFMWYIIPQVTNGSWSKEKFMLKFISPCFEVIPETVGQYTGLIDKNRKEIFEGDIVQPANYAKEYRVVVWHDNGFELEYRYTRRIEEKDTKLKSYTPIRPNSNVVVGNIYENPELLEVQQ